jgi:serine/threonine protein kinase/tetratricopeptide (TPR) repeat protein
MICPNCHAQNPDGAVACLSCSSALSGGGATLSGSDATLSPVPAPTLLPGAAGAPSAGPDRSKSAPPGPNVFPEGMEIGQRYKVKRLLGRGGMGAVYLVHDRELDRDVALKVIRTDIADDPETLERFKREIQLSHVVTHKNVLRVYDLGEGAGIKFVTMQYVDGEDLASLIKREGKLPVTQIVSVFRQTCQALAEAHAQGVVHRDLKPQNIMLDKAGNVFLTDFGLARSVEASGMTQTGAVLGTPFYMSPEQVRGETADHRSDIYSLGIILYEMATGKVPYSTGSAYQVMVQRLQRAPQPVSELNPDFPAYLRKILERCMATDLEARYQSVGDILADLESSSFSTSLRYEVKRRSRLLRTIGVAAAVALLAFLGWRLYHSRPPAKVAARKVESVLVSDFDNRTGDPLFANTLEPAFATALEGASFINAYSRSQAARLAQRLQPGVTGLPEAAARLVAVREGVDVVVSGVIERKGSGFELSVQAVDAVTGKPITTADVDTSGKDDALRAVAKLAARVRKALGDTTPESVQLAAAETFSAGSLEAAHEYAVAQQLQWQGKLEDAITHYSRAINLDPKLGRAYAGLAVAYANLNRRQESETYYKLAMARIDRMSEREQFRTEGGYFLMVREPHKAIEQFEQLVKEFPADSAGYANLALAYFFTRDMQRALSEGRRAVEISPKNALQRNNLGLYAMYAGDFDTAIEESRKVLELNPAFSKADLCIALSQLGNGHPEEAAQTYARIAGLDTWGASIAPTGLADLALYQGRVGDAITILRNGVDRDVAANDPESAAGKLVMLAEALLLHGQKAEAVAAADRAVGMSRGENILFPAARVYIENEREPKALALATELSQRLGPDYQAYAGLIRGEAQLRSGKTREAITTFEGAQKTANTWIGCVDLGRAYLDANAFTEAHAQLEICRERRGEATAAFLDDVPTYHLFPPVLYYLGRAHEGLKSPEAADSYKSFLAIKDKSDPDPMVADARRRLAAHTH